MIVQIIACIYKVRKKSRIIIYHYGWGIGHSIHDTEFFRKNFGLNETALIFFNIGKHNTLLSKVFIDIKIIFIKSFINLLFADYKIQLNKKYNLFFSNIIFEILRLIYKDKKINTIEEIREKICIEKKINIDNLYYLFQPDYQNPKRVAITLPLKYVKKIETKLSEFFGNNYNSADKKNITFYIRNKGNDPNEKSESYRSSSPFKDYLKIFSYLIDTGYQVFIYGDYDTAILKKGRLFNKIACYESVNLKKDEFCIYSALNSEYFIASSGGGAFFPFSRENYPKSLVLNAFPFTFELPYATIVYKNAINKDGKFLSVDELLNKSNTRDLKADIEILNNSETIIYESVKEFLNFHKRFPNLYDIDENEFYRKDNYSKNKIRLSPVWINYTVSNL